jgi:hypothetical protein
MAIIRKKEAEGAEIKKDDVGMLAIELGINECEGTGEDQSNEIVLTGAEGTLVDKEPLQTPIDPFRGSNNPFMSEKDLRELRKYRHREREPLMGDVPSPEELRRIEERERLRREEEYRKEIEKREKRDKGFLNKVINRIKSFFEPTLMGEVEI